VTGDSSAQHGDSQNKPQDQAKEKPPLPKTAVEELGIAAPSMVQKMLKNKKVEEMES